MECVVCGKTGLKGNHKCSKAGIARYNRRLGGKAAADKRRDKQRYGCGNTVGDRITAGVIFMREGT